jgi:serine protease Do
MSFSKSFFDGQPGMPMPRESESLGSGFVLSADGYILTNHHVIKDAEEIVVRFSDRTEMDAELLGSDERSDVALLKVDATDLKAVKLGDSNDLKVGEWVLAIGSPFGFDYSATAGIVSALGRSLPSDSYVPFIQTDVAINPGNSGGPLFNLDGEVVGINSQIYSRTGGFMGVSFAIPIDTVMNVVAQIKSQGYVSRGWLGVVIQDVTRELAESFGLNKPKGALVSRVVADSPASRAGFKAGDVILEFDGKEVETSSDLPPIVGRTLVGKQANVIVMRDNKRKTIKVTIEELPEDEELAATGTKPGRFVAENLSMEVAEIRPEQRDKLEVKKGGVAVMKVEQGPAMTAGIRPGDVILSINNVDVNEAHHFIEITKDLPANKPVPVLIQRAGQSQFLALKLGK